MQKKLPHVTRAACSDTLKKEKLVSIDFSRLEKREREIFTV